MILTLLVLKLEYSRITKLIPWLLMPWRLVSPGHQQPWHWLCRINRSLFSKRKGFNCLHNLNFRNGRKCWYIFMFPKIHSAQRGFSTSHFKVVQWVVSLHIPYSLLWTSLDQWCHDSDLLGAGNFSKIHHINWGDHTPILAPEITLKKLLIQHRPDISHIRKYLQ